jgi:hypothetical protein
MPSPHTSPHLPWSSRRPQLASPLTNEIVGKVEGGSASGVVTEREGGDLANGARGITIFAVPYDSGHRALRMGAGLDVQWCQQWCQCHPCSGWKPSIPNR